MNETNELKIKTYEIDPEVFAALVNYLRSRPYAEVASFLNLIGGQKQVKAVLEESKLQVVNKE